MGASEAPASNCLTVATMPGDFARLTNPRKNGRSAGKHITDATPSAAIFAFLTSWNQYLWPVLITTDEKYNTVQTGLKALKQDSLGQPNLVIAGTVIIALPIFIVLISFQRQLVRGLTAGAVKG